MLKSVSTFHSNCVDAANVEKHRWPSLVSLQDSAYSSNLEYLGSSWSPRNTSAAAGASAAGPGCMIGSSMGRSSADSKQALLESETRRLLLVEKMKEAQDTITLQSKRLTDTERHAKEKDFEVEESKFKEREYQRKIKNLEQDYLNIQDRQSNWLKVQDDKQSKIETLTAQVENLRDVNNLLKMECQRKQVEFDEQRSKIQKLEEMIESLIKAKDVACRESTTLLDNVQTAQSRVEQLEKQLKSNKLDLNKLQEANETLMSENVDVHNQLLKSRNNNSLQKDKISALNSRIQDLTIAYDNQTQDLNNCREKMKNCCEEKQNMDRTNQVAIQQHARFQEEIRKLESELTNFKKHFEETSRSNAEEKETLQKEIYRLKETLRKLETEKSTLVVKLSETESQVKLFDKRLQETTGSLQNEMNNWKKKSEKLAKDVGCKEVEAEILGRRVQDLEVEVELLHCNKAAYQDRSEELNLVREQLIRSEDETRRLMQERLENQQMIELLEVQKDVLFKLCRKETPHSTDGGSFAVTSDILPTSIHPSSTTEQSRDRNFE